MVKMSDIENMYLDYVGKSSKKLNDDVVKDLNIVKGLDFQIESLVRQRNYILYGLNERTSKYKSFVSMLGYPPKSVMKEYNSNGFKSDIVKGAVMNLRKLFFDDEDHRFQDFSCTQIINDSYQGSDIKFLFSDSSGHEIMFSFSIASKNYNYLYNSKFLVGYVYFLVKKGNNFHTSIRSFDVYKIRDCVKGYINNGYVAEQYKFETKSIEEKIGEIFKGFEQNSLNSMYFEGDSKDDN